MLYKVNKNSAVINRKFVEVTRISYKPFHKGHIIEGADGQLELIVNKDQKNLVLESKNSHNNAEYLIYVTCAQKTFRITGVYRRDNVFHINSIADQDGKNVSGDLNVMEGKLGFNDITPRIEIDSISKEPFVSQESANDNMPTLSGTTIHKIADQPVNSL